MGPSSELLYRRRSDILPSPLYRPYQIPRAYQQANFCHLADLDLDRYHGNQMPQPGQNSSIKSSAASMAALASYMAAGHGLDRDQVSSDGCAGGYLLSEGFIGGLRSSDCRWGHGWPRGPDIRTTSLSPAAVALSPPLLITISKENPYQPACICWPRRWW